MRSSRPSPLSRTLALVPPVVALVAQHADGAMFLKVGTLVGEVAEVKHREWIQVESVDFKVENPVTLGSSGTGITAGKPTGSALTVTKLLDRTSPLLFLGCASGTRYQTVILELTVPNSSGANITYYRITLTNVIVSSMGTSSGGDRPGESVALNYEKIVAEYYMQDAKGVISQNPTTTVVWDFATNK